MTTKDWILLFVPILCNGILFVIFQKVFLDRYIRRRLMKEDIIKEFLNKLKSFSDLIIQSGFDSNRDANSVPENVSEMQNRYIDLIKFNTANKYDLTKFSSAFDQFCKNWSMFVDYYNKLALDRIKKFEQREVVGDKLQDVFDSLNVLIETVRKKY